MKNYTIPNYNMSGSNHFETLKSAIILLSEKYLVDHELMGDKKRIEVLETIVNLNQLLLALEDQRNAQI